MYDFLFNCSTIDVFGQACVEKLVEVSDGDMRRAIMYLQSMSQLKIEKEIAVEDVYEISGLIPIEIVAHLAEAWKSKQAFKSIKQKVDDIRKSGYSGAQVMDQVGLLVPRRILIAISCLITS
jgi:replication factor C subunit 2/4